MRICKPHVEDLRLHGVGELVAVVLVLEQLLLLPKAQRFKGDAVALQREVDVAAAGCPVCWGGHELVDRVRARELTLEERRRAAAIVDGALQEHEDHGTDPRSPAQ